jgi:hypothetical protein
MRDVREVVIVLTQTLDIRALRKLRSEPHELLLEHQRLPGRVEDDIPVALPDHLEAERVFLPFEAQS